MKVLNYKIKTSDMLGRSLDSKFLILKLVDWNRNCLSLLQFIRISIFISTKDLNLIQFYLFFSEDFSQPPVASWDPIPSWWHFLNCSNIDGTILRMQWWVSCIFVPLVTQSCRRMKGPYRHGWLVVLRRIFSEHNDYGYLLYPWVATFSFYAFYLLVQGRSFCISRILMIKIAYQ